MIAGFGRNSGRAKAAIKVDLAKAYDMCDRESLEITLRELKFSEEWIRLVMMCVTTTSLAFLIDGVPTRLINQTNQPDQSISRL